jgi:hypothetical protein
MPRTIARALKEIPAHVFKELTSQVRIGYNAASRHGDHLGRPRKQKHRGTSSFESCWRCLGPHQPAAISVLGILIFVLALGPLVAQKASTLDEIRGRKEETSALVRRRAQWYFRQRASIQGHIPSSFRLQALAENARLIRAGGTFTNRFSATGFAIAPNMNQWTSLGPQPTVNTPFYGNVSGRVTATASDPCDTTGNTIYVGGADGGIWVSFNALSRTSTTWKPLSDNQPSLSTGSLSLDSSSCHTINGHSQSNAIFAGTGESNFALDNLYGAGVLRSTDGGQTWQQDSTFVGSSASSKNASGPYIAKIAVQPGRSNPALLAAIQGTDFSSGGTLLSGIWRSTDASQHWVRVQPDGGGATGAPFNPGTDVVFDSSDSSGNTVYAALGDPDGDSDSKASCSAPPCNGVYVSTNAGSTWNRVSGLDAASDPAAYGLISLSVAPGASPSTSKLYVAIANSSNLQNPSSSLLGVLKGTGIGANGAGGTWTNISSTSGLPDFCTPQCFYDMQIGAVPSSSGEVVFVGGSAQPPGVGKSSIFRSMDGGNSWADFSADGSGNNTSTHVDVHAFSFATGAGAQVLGMFVGNDGGVWASQDAFDPATASGNQHWADLNTNTGNPSTSLNITQFYPGASISPVSDQTIYGGTQGNDAQQYSGSLAWSDTEACPYDGGFTAIDQQVPTTIYVACSYLGGPGTLNKNVLNGVPGTDGVNWAAIDFDNGMDFSDNADFIPPLVIDAKNSQNLYFGTYRLYQTTNAGGTWSPITSDLTTDNSENFVTTITVAPSDSTTLYVGTSDGLIWQISDALSNSINVHKVSHANLQPARFVTAISVDSLNPQSAFAAYSGFSCPGVSGCDGLGHIFFTNNSGASWTKVDGNLPDIPVNSIVIDPADTSDNTIYVGTDSGVYATANATAGSGTTWSVLSSGLPNSEVLSLNLSKISRTLIAATHGRGMWSLLLPNFTTSDDFSFGTVSPASQTVSTGGTANYVVPVSPVGAGSPVTLSCSGLPAGATCTFTPNPVTPAAGGTNVALAIAVPSSAIVPFRLATPRFTSTLYRLPLVVLILGLVSLLLVSKQLLRARRFAVAFTCVAIFLVLVSMSACGGGSGGGGGGQGQAFQIEIMGSSGNTFQHSTTVQLIVN